MAFSTERRGERPETSTRRRSGLPDLAGIQANRVDWQNALEPIRTGVTVAGHAAGNCQAPTAMTHRSCISPRPAGQATKAGTSAPFWLTWTRH